ncbi:hypothetical protein BP5796_05087 [Coleophoma crateriformis]|uniref:Uncharacterized protein n=1 Tax=Coleophoma crateriformis TaxID=565419 RepID=A0A3D8S286_9HELO|nr:hypothetical protein BP5796_05087 [Coleophoma crateriformis]
MYYDDTRSPPRRPPAGSAAGVPSIQNSGFDLDSRSRVVKHNAKHAQMLGAGAWDLLLQNRKTTTTEVRQEQLQGSSQGGTRRGS